MGVLTDLLSKRLGVKSRPIVNPLVAAVGVAEIPIALAHPDRVSITFVNLSANIIYISPLPGVTAVVGIRLDPNGGWRSLVWDEDFELVSMPWYAIATGAASAFYSLEMIAETSEVAV